MYIVWTHNRKNIAHVNDFHQEPWETCSQLSTHLTLSWRSAGKNTVLSKELKLATPYFF